MVDGSVLKEMSYIVDKTVLTYNIFNGRIFEETNKGTAWTRDLQK